MDLHSDYMEPVTPGVTYENVGYWKTEDSGYHTSYTPGTLECSEISSDNFNPAIFKGNIGFTGQFQVGCYDVQSDVNFRPTLQFSTGINRSRESYTESPQNRRGVKRAFQEDSENRDLNFGSLPTPTSIIAGGLCKLRFSEKKLNASFSSANFESADLADRCGKNERILTTYPTTPIKKVCITSCKLSSPLNPRKPPKKLNFAMHSLSCDVHALQPRLNTAKPHNHPGTIYKFKPHQKVDIMKMLYQEANVIPPVMKIFSYLSNEDIYNFTLVSPLWQNIWEDISKGMSKKQEYFLHYLKDEKDNLENKLSTPKNNNPTLIRPLMEIHNVLNNYNHDNIIRTTSTPISPPGTPKTIRFKRFTRAASLDLRKQLSCVRCQRPAKVTEERSGEEWVECTSFTCAYQFCRFCKCERHPGKNCFQYDLDGPSPSKRKKNMCAVGTKKSRKNLRRLL